MPLPTSLETRITEQETLRSDRARRSAWARTRSGSAPHAPSGWKPRRSGSRSRACRIGGRIPQRLFQSRRRFEGCPRPGPLGAMPRDALPHVVVTASAVARKATRCPRWQIPARSGSSRCERHRAPVQFFGPNPQDILHPAHKLHLGRESSCSNFPDDPSRRVVQDADWSSHRSQIGQR